MVGVNCSRDELTPPDKRGKECREVTLGVVCKGDQSAFSFVQTE